MTDLLAIRARLFEGIALHLLERGSKDGWCVSIKTLRHETGLEYDLLRGCLRDARERGRDRYQAAWREINRLRQRVAELEARP